MATFEIIYASIAFAIFLGLLVLGAPFYVSFLAASIPVLLWGVQAGFICIGELGVDAVESFTLIAIPLFILLGNMMSVCGAVTLLFDIARAFIGHIPGGMGMAGFVACAMFGTMCGSSSATALAMSTVVTPELIKHGYSRELSAVICATGAGLALLIPPSISFILIGAVMKLNIGDLFIAGIVPGIITTGLLCITVYLRVRGKKEVKIGRRYSWRERGRVVLRAAPVGALPLAIIGCLWGGICTPTEAAGVSCVVALLLARFYFHKFGLKEANVCLKDTAVLSGVVYCMIIGGLTFGGVISYLHVPQWAGAALSGLGLGVSSFKFVFIGIFFVLGMFIDPIVLILVALPAILPTVLLYPSIPPIGFAILFTVMINVAEVTPPVGEILYEAILGARASVAGAIRELPLFLLAVMVSAFLFAFVPVLACIY
jgi:C4-dicarboxylate transporter DctM subunit